MARLASNGMDWNSRPQARLLAAISVVFGLSASGCSFQATRNYDPDGTPSSSSVSSGFNVGLPGLRGLGGGGGGGGGSGGGSPDAGGGSSAGMGSGGMH